MTEDDLRDVMRRLRANEISENYAFSRAVAFAQSELSTLKGENERLRGDIPDDAIYMRDVGNDEYDCWVPCINGDPGYVAFVPASRIAKVEAQRDELVEACKPFAEAAESSGSADDGEVPDAAHAWESSMAMAVTYGDFRRARTALQTGDKG